MPTPDELKERLRRQRQLREALDELLETSKDYVSREDMAAAIESILRAHNFHARVQA